MSSLNDRIAHEVFEKHVAMVYWLARKWVPRITARWGKDVPPVELEELVQDAVARAAGSFFRRVAKHGLPKLAKRRAWVGQCTMSAVKHALCARRAFGNEVPFNGYVDAMDRRGCPDKRAPRHGTDSERENWLSEIHYVPVEYPVQRWEIEELLEREHVPAKLRKTAVYAAMGIGQEDSGKLQGCCERTIRNRMTELREWLNPPCTRNVYTVVIEALQEILDGNRQ